MVKSMEETAAERIEYINEIRASFQNPTQNPSASSMDDSRQQGLHAKYQEETASSGFSGLGFRTLIAVLLFAAFVYCDQKKITFQEYETKDVISQIEWNPLPLEELEDIISIQP